jgi:hypothetical protein
MQFPVSGQSPETKRPSFGEKRGEWEYQSWVQHKQKEFLRSNEKSFNDTTNYSEILHRHFADTFLVFVL